MEQALIVLSFIAMVIAPCVIASRIDLEAEEAYLDRRDKGTKR
jgi:hypothetical protein